MARSDSRVTRAVAGFDPLPSRARSASLAIDVAPTAPADAEAIGIPVATAGDIPPAIGVDRALLLESGFTGAVGQTLALPRGVRPVVVAVGVGEPGALDAAGLRDAAAAFARAVARDGRLATTLGDVTDVDPETAGQAIVEGILLARYRYRAFVDRPSEAALTALTLVTRRRSGDRARGRCRPRPDHGRSGPDRPRPGQHARHPPDGDPDGGDGPGARDRRPASVSRSSTRTRWSPSAAAACSA